MSGRLAALAAILCLSFSLLPAQHPSKSAALKRYRPPEAPALVRPYDETARLWQEFMLVRNANGGDAEAQHELGLRHLFGEGFPADTAKAALWIARAAAQRLPTAAFNYGILLNNGWGVPWNPFAAYANFEFAASRGVADAEYAFGLFLLDNLAVPRDEREARCWIKAAADSAYLPAVELLGVLDARSSGAEPRAEERKSRKEASAGRFGLVFLDFNQDTSAHVSDEMLVEDLAASPADSGAVARSAPAPGSAVSQLHEASVRSLEELARPGNPEALALLGRWLETRSDPDVIGATLAYERAIRFDSPRAPELLWNLVRAEGYFETLGAAVEKGSADAAVAWAVLAALGFDRQITDAQALAFLAQAAEAGHVQAMVELGLCYLTGRWAAADRERGLAWWSRAAELGSDEASIRLISTRLLTATEPPPAPDDMERLRAAARLGAVQAELALAYALESGRGAVRDTPGAVRAYRSMAQRGSRVAYESLRRMYDAVRPPEDPAFVFPP